jgi:outer membrane protein
MISWKRPALLCAGIAATFAVPSNASAMEQGDWLVRAGASVVAPESDNGTLNLGLAAPGLPSTDISVDDATGFTFTVSYFFNQNIAVELLAAYPYTQDFELESVNIDGKVDHLPPTLSVQYHFPIDAKWKPYVGVGVNWTMFSNAKVDAPVGVDIDDSFGPAAQVGIDYALNDRWMINVDLRYIGIEGDVNVAGAKVGTVDINPWVYGINIGYRF